ncbi:hypothetical protein BDN72DRAFT_906865, partial [Pluteus cervinus]
MQLQFTWTDVQRLSLELIGILDYMQIHHPCMIGLKDPAIKTAHTIGAFTYSTIVAQEFQRAGLPVWLIQPFDKLPTTRIDAVTDARLPLNFVVSRDASPLPFPAFDILPDDAQKYAKMAKNHRNLYQPPEPFKLEFKSRKPLPLSRGPSRDHESTPRSSTYTSRSLGASRSSSDAPHSSNRSRSSNTSRSPSLSRSFTAPSDVSRSSAHSQRSVTSPQESYLNLLFCPPTSECWHKALRTPLPTPATTKPVGWLFPNVALFLRVTTDEKRFQYVSNWLRHREDLIFRLTDPTFIVVPLRSQDWRDFLNFGDTQPTTREDGSTSKVYARRKAVLEMLGTCTNASGIQVADGSSNAGLMWNGSTLTRDQILSPRILCQVLMELNELNFRFELAALDRHHRSPEQEDVWNMAEENTNILHCFPATTSLLYVDLSEFRYGLAGTIQRSRSPYVMSLGRIMSNWDHCPGVIMNGHSNVGRMTAEQYTDFENAVASFYVHTFYYHFGRLPAVPLRGWVVPYPKPFSPYWHILNSPNLPMSTSQRLSGRAKRPSSRALGNDGIQIITQPTPTTPTATQPTPKATPKATPKPRKVKKAALRKSKAADKVEVSGRSASPIPGVDTTAAIEASSTPVVAHATANINGTGNSQNGDPAAAVEESSTATNTPRDEGTLNGAGAKPISLCSVLVGAINAVNAINNGLPGTNDMDTLDGTNLGPIGAPSSVIATLADPPPMSIANSLASGTQNVHRPCPLSSVLEGDDEQAHAAIVPPKQPLNTREDGDDPALTDSGDLIDIDEPRVPRPTSPVPLPTRPRPQSRTTPLFPGSPAVIVRREFLPLPEKAKLTSAQARDKSSGGRRDHVQNQDTHEDEGSASGLESVSGIVGLQDCVPLEIDFTITDDNNRIEDPYQSVSLESTEFMGALEPSEFTEPNIETPDVSSANGMGTQDDDEAQDLGDDMDDVGVEEEENTDNDERLKPGPIPKL